MVDALMGVYDHGVGQFVVVGHGGEDVREEEEEGWGIGWWHRRSHWA